jgi:hypothetical protein
MLTIETYHHVQFPERNRPEKLAGANMWDGATWVLNQSCTLETGALSTLQRANLFLVSMHGTLISASGLSHY